MLGSLRQLEMPPPAQHMGDLVGVWPRTWMLWPVDMISGASWFRPPSGNSTEMGGSTTNRLLMSKIPFVGWQYGQIIFPFIYWLISQFYGLTPHPCWLHTPWSWFISPYWLNIFQPFCWPNPYFKVETALWNRSSVITKSFFDEVDWPCHHLFVVKPFIFHHSSWRITIFWRLILIFLMITWSFSRGFLWHEPFDLECSLPASYRPGMLGRTTALPAAGGAFLDGDSWFDWIYLRVS